MTPSGHRLLPYKSCFYYAICPATRLDSSREKWKSNRHERIKTTVESLQCIKKDPSVGGGMEAKRESDRNRGKTRVNGGHPLDGGSAGVVSESVPLLICVSSYMRRLKTGILSTRTASNKTHLIINTTGCFTLPCHGTGIRVSRSNCDS